MNNRQKYEPYIGQTWLSADMTPFVITDLTITEDDAWVSYINGPKEYQCRLEAFRVRFSPQAD